MCNEMRRENSQPRNSKPAMNTGDQATGSVVRRIPERWVAESDAYIIIQSSSEFAL
jgi:hypothetical protein